ncbi:MAG: hypothetical protein M1838_000959 [Thelocarpon superellum]|nr:MAG: hypothetical protein M1838_000959 [Thelocarpon superellum]
MPLIQESHDSLPYIDPDLSPAAREGANQAINAELTHATTLHPSIPEAPAIQFSDLIQQEISRQAENRPREGGVDLSRYEALDAPTETSAGDEAQRWREVLQKSYASSTHLSIRLTNLALLEEFGKNAWLIANAQLEDVLRALESELVARREQTEQVNKARKAGQESVRGELEALNQSWREGVGKVIEAELAAEAVRQEILDRRREQAARD